MRTSELIGAALDWAVLKASKKAIGQPDHLPFNVEWLLMRDAGDFQYSTNWAQGGPIIERERMDIKCWDFHSMPWKASMWWDDEASSGDVQMYGSTPLIAAMRCYVASKLGDEVEIPEEITE
tara:strand:- start:937 stop:1302 length:366 start_codon:yes stop_codon:yes gene_type:complete